MRDHVYAPEVKGLGQPNIWPSHTIGVILDLVWIGKSWPARNMSVMVSCGLTNIYMQYQRLL